MGQIFSGAALLPFLMQFTIHRREQIAAQSQHQRQHKHRNCVEVCSLFLTLAERLWQILAEVTVLRSATMTITRPFMTAYLKLNSSRMPDA